MTTVSAPVATLAVAPLSFAPVVDNSADILAAAKLVLPRLERDVSQISNG